MANNTVVISRIQNRRGRRENLPQPLLPGEFALTADTGEVWIGGDPALAVPSVRVYKDKLQSNAQDIVDNNIAEAKFTGGFSAVDFTTLVNQLINDNSVTLTEQDIIFDDTYRGTVLSITVDNAGTGYTTGDAVTATSSTGTGFVGFVVDDGSGGIDSITITSGGENYLASNTTFNIAGGSGGVLSVDEFDIHGYSVFIAADDDVDPDNTIVNIATAVASTSPGGLYSISTTALGGTFTGNLLILDTQKEASAVATLVNRVNASTPGQTTGLVHTSLNIEVTGSGDFSLLSEVLNLFTSTVTTTNDTQTTLQTLVIEDDFQNMIIARVKGYEEATGDAIWKYIRALVKNEGGTVSFVGSLSSDMGFDAGAAGWDITMSAVANTLLIQVTGETAHTIDWETVTEISYAVDDSVLAPVVPGHSHTLDSLTDVDVGSPGAGEDGYVLTWDNGTGFYVLAAPTGGGGGGDVEDLDDLDDVVITSVADNEVLAYDNGTGNWINQTAAEAGLATSSHTHTINDLSDVTISGPADNEVLAYDNGSGTWINQTAAEAGLATASHSHALASLSDVNVGTPGSEEDGYSLVWDNNTSRFVLADVSGGGGGGGAESLNDLNDVTITTPALDQFLVVVNDDPITWANQSRSFANVGYLNVPVNAQNGDYEIVASDVGTVVAVLDLETFDNDATWTMDDLNFSVGDVVTVMNINANQVWWCILTLENGSFMAMSDGSTGTIVELPPPGDMGPSQATLLKVAVGLWTVTGINANVYDPEE